jgi:hypothetical protein
MGATVCSSSNQNPVVSTTTTAATVSGLCIRSPVGRTIPTSARPRDRLLPSLQRRPTISPMQSLLQFLSSKYNQREQQLGTSPRIASSNSIPWANGENLGSIASVHGGQLLASTAWRAQRCDVELQSLVDEYDNNLKNVNGREPIFWVVEGKTEQSTAAHTAAEEGHLAMVERLSKEITEVYAALQATLDDALDILTSLERLSHVMEEEEKVAADWRAKEALQEAAEVNIVAAAEVGGSSSSRSRRKHGRGLDLAAVGQVPTFSFLWNVGGKKVVDWTV